MIKAAFFDIDGTLVSLKTKRFPDTAKAAISQLKKKGILCYVATGRSKFEIQTENLLEDMTFDGVLTNNGQDAYDENGSLIYGKPLNPAEAAAVLDWLDANEAGCWMVSATQSMMNCTNQRVRDTLIAIHTQPPQLGNLHTMLKEPIYKMAIFLPEEEMAPIMALAPTSRMTRWCPTGHDLISADGGKKNAMMDILASRGISPSETIAFGDSQNDAEMLSAAGIGVAMGNATADAKAVADYITDDCDEDGLYKALQHYKLL